MKYETYLKEIKEQEKQTQKWRTFAAAALAILGSSLLLLIAFYMGWLVSINEYSSDQLIYDLFSMIISNSFIWVFVLLEYRKYRKL